MRVRKTDLCTTEQQKQKKPAEHSIFPKNNRKHSALRMDNLRELKVGEGKGSTSAKKSGYLVKN